MGSFDFALDSYNQHADVRVAIQMLSISIYP